MYNRTNTTRNASSTWEGAPANDLKAQTQQPASLPSPSPFQQAVYDWIPNGHGNASVVAVAGAGKTTTLNGAANCIPPGLNGYAVVFNKRNADELRDRFPRHVMCGTFHSIWMRACRSNLGQFTVEGRKTDVILDELLPHTESRDARGRSMVRILPSAFPYAKVIRKLVGCAKNAGVGKLLPNAPETYREFIDHFDLYTECENLVEKKLLEYTMQALAMSREMTSMIDFDDMLYLPLVNGWGVERRDFVFVDEAQDSNAVQRELVRRMVKTNGRIIFVGDPHQAIYGFRGATSNAMDTIRDQFQTTELPLTVSYRCPKAVVKYAQKYVSHITAADNAPEGEVNTIEGKLPKSMLKAGTAIVCRTTAPVVSLAFSMIAKRIPCFILGRDIGVKLVQLVESMKASSLSDLSAALEAYRVREVERAKRKRNDTREQLVNDQVDSLEAVISSMAPGSGVSDVVFELKGLFTDDTTTNRVILSTVHKAKGLEWDRVVIIRPDLIPLPWVKKAWQLEQENNLAYVAATRAKRELVILRSLEPEIDDKA